MKKLICLSTLATLIFRNKTVCHTGRSAKCLNFVSLACEVNKMFLCFLRLFRLMGAFDSFIKLFLCIHAHEWSLKPNLIAATCCQTSGACHLREKIKAGMNFSSKQLKFSTKKLRRV